MGAQFGWDCLWLMQGIVCVSHFLLYEEEHSMNQLQAKPPDYGNWVSTKFIYVPSVVGLVLLGLALAFPISIIAAVLFLGVAAYFAYARYRFSPHGGDVQARIEKLVIDHLDWNGQGDALDIGCGNAPLTIAIAKKFPKARVTGIDYWGGAWDYSKSVCAKNAASEGVADRVNFQKASASALPFEDKSFDVVVSNLVFHEVADAKDKRDVVKQALCVVKKGGKFAFQDLFLIKKMYGDMDDLLAVIKSWGIEQVEFLDTSKSAFIPNALRLPFMVGTISILYGKK
jgi:SAM-dependent methyltransferase